MQQSNRGGMSLAIVGMAFRFPGGLNDENLFWQALKVGKDAVGQVGPERWAVDELRHPKRSEPGRSITFSAGVLSRIDEFDAAFFGISPREAAWLDPQQRLLLELAWEAMENGGCRPSSLAGSDCAVYVGISGFDYGVRGLGDLSSVTAHTMTGNTLSIAANRLSYIFDLRGPSLAVDTACSSSLVALHHACNSLRAGEASMALVGGVNLLLHPYPFIGFTKASMLSAHGQCRAFDASGDGYVRSEGGAVLLLKPYEKAVADGDDIQAVILASGVNSDGGRKTGITIPSSDGQAELMRSVLERSGLSPLDVDFVEAHGTGTQVGDPVEAAAIGAVYGHGRPARQPLPIGSVKTNLGHLEPASGMAGLVKTVLALKNHALPPSLNLVSPNPKIDFGKLNLEVVTEYRQLAKSGCRPLVAGVNSFGFGGANAHVLLQEHLLEESAAQVVDSPPPPMFLSARTMQALREMAARFAELLGQGLAPNYYDVAYSVAYRRERLEKRLALRGGDAKEAQESFARFANGETANMILEDALAEPGGLAFVYSGNGAQWVGMARRLLQESQSFARHFAALEKPILARAGFSILEELLADESASHLADTAVAQPLLFAIQIALTMILREQGVEPVAVVGHSVGEVAAAWAAGVLDLAQAIEVICARSAAQAYTHGAGRMAAVSLSAAAMAEILIAENYASIEIAGINSPNSVTLAGTLEDLGRLSKLLKTRGVVFKLLDLEYAFHSRMMDQIQSMLLDSLAALKARQSGGISFVSTVTGDLLDGAALDAQYWWQNVRQPVRFAAAMAKLAALGCRVFVEIGPHAILQRYMNECLAAEGVEGRVMSTLRKGHDGWATVEEVILRTHLLCDSAQCEVFFPVPGRHIRLPNYPWQRERHWLPSSGEGYNLIERCRIHPLLGWRLTETDSAWENVLDPADQRWLADHRVGGSVVFPGAAYVEMALAASREWFGGADFEIEELDIVAPIVFDGEHGRSVRFEFLPRDGSFQIRSRQRLSDDDWTINASGRLLGSPAGQAAFTAWDGNAGAAINIDGPAHYGLAAAIGLDYGPLFQGLERAYVQGDTLLATLGMPTALQGAKAGYLLHPALLDVCFQSLLDFFKEDIEAGRGVPLLPVKVGRLRLYGDGRSVKQFRVSIRKRSPRSVLADFDLLDSAGNVVAVLSACRFRAAVVQMRNGSASAVWRIKRRLVPHMLEQQSMDLPANSKLLKPLSAWFGEAESRLQRTAYFEEIFPLFDALVISFAYAAFQQLFADQDEWLQQVLTSSSRVEESPSDFMRWLIECLRQEGLLVKDGNSWRLEPTDIPPPDDIWRTLLRDYPACLPELVSVGRVGRHLVELLNGKADGASLLSQLRLSHPCETLYDDDPAYLGVRLAIQQTLRSLAANWPSHRRLRVLEISAGASELPRQLGELLPPDRIDYVLAHYDEEICARLQAEYQDHSFATVAKVGEDRLEPFAGNSLPEQFDVLILRHWAHRVRNPYAVLAMAGRHLVRGGLLLLAERHPDLSADFVNGIDPGWWLAGEGARPVSRLQPPAVWRNVLEERGWESVETFVEPASERVQGGCYLLLAKRSNEQAVAPEAPPSKAWLLLADANGPAHRLAEQLIHHLESHGQRAVLAIAGSDEEAGKFAFDPLDRKSVGHMVAAAYQRLSGLDHIVHLNGLGVFTPDTTGNCTGLLHLVRELAESCSEWPQLWIITAGGALTADVDVVEGGDPSQAALWGFARVIMNEYPALACRLIDISSTARGVDSAAALTAELLWPDAEEEIVLSTAGRYGLRLEPGTASVDIADSVAPRFHLDFHVPGQLRNLVWMPSPKPALADDEIEVQTVAAGLNFRDVMYLMGLLPDEAVENGFAGASLGLEFAGVITRTGARVRDLLPGEAVMGFGSACFASHVVTTASAVARKPEGWSFEAAATVPTVFFTVYYALKHLANLQPGERVLIHGAAGGVGIAAVQLARYLGAEVFATAGSSEKRDFVDLLGVDHVLDSRSLAFADEILTLTYGEGVDVVLNSLAGEAIRRNLRVLKPFGRFLELGKRDFFENTPIGLRPFKDNISYFGIDADQLLIARPDLAARLFREVMGLFHEGVLSTLPCRVFPAERVVDAFRVMQQSRHIGKVVVSFDEARVVVRQPRVTAPAVSLREDATYVVTGGVSGFGLESARWLVEHGAGNLVLLSRRGLQTPGAADGIAELEKLGARVHVMACDVAERASLERVLAQIHRDLPPLRGVLHAAMVLDDALIANLDAEHFANVLAPKILGAKHLHDLTLDVPLDHFILYSSITTFIGNPGQANYVAANAYLEGLAALRRSLGLPAICIGWGPIGDAGYLTRNETVKESLIARLGAAPLTSRDALAMLGQLLASEAATCAVANFDWHALARLLPSAQGPRFEDLRRQAGSRAAGGPNSEDFGALIAGKPAVEVTEIVRSLVVQEVAQILCIGADRIDSSRSLHDLGMDSLMGVELALALERRCGIQFSAMMLNEGPTVERITSRIVEKLIGEDAADDVSEERRLSDLVGMLAAQHGEKLSDDDLAETADSVRQLAKSGTGLVYE